MRDINILSGQNAHLMNIKEFDACSNNQVLNRCHITVLSFLTTVIGHIQLEQ